MKQEIEWTPFPAVNIDLSHIPVYILPIHWPAIIFLFIFIYVYAGQWNMEEYRNVHTGQVYGSGIKILS